MDKQLETKTVTCRYGTENEYLDNLKNFGWSLASKKLLNMFGNPLATNEKVSESDLREKCSLNEKGSGKFEVTGLSNSKELKESVKIAQNYFKANAKHISQTISLEQKDYMMHVEDCHGIGIDSSISLAVYISYISAALGRPLASQMMVLGSMTIGGTISKVENLADSLQVCFDAGAKKILLPMSNAADIATVPSELFAKFQTSFYTSPEDAAIKALGIE